MAVPKPPPVPLHDRQAASEAIDRLTRDLGGRPEVAAALKVPVAAVERALYGAMTPATFQKLLAYLECDAGELRTVVMGGELPRKRPWPPIEEAILCAGRFCPVATEKEIRAIARELHGELAELKGIAVLERLFLEITERILKPAREARMAERRERSEKRRRLRGDHRDGEAGE
jgi:hypothetical protein